MAELAPQLRQGTWGELEPEMYVRTPDGGLWRVQAQRQGWTRFERPDPAGENMVTFDVGPQDDDAPVMLYAPAPMEILRLVSEFFGPKLAWEQMDARATQIAIAEQWNAGLIAQGGAGARRTIMGHLIASHGERMNGGNPSIKELHEFHDSLHESHAHPMIRPHHHKEL